MLGNRNAHTHKYTYLVNTMPEKTKRKARDVPENEKKHISGQPFFHNMSIANGKQQKRVSKKQSNVSTAAVYPILQSGTVQHTSKNSDSDLLDSPGFIDSDVTAHHIKAQCVRGRPVAEHSIATSVAELVSEVMPQGNSQHNLQSEPICWVKIQKCSCDFRGRSTTFIVVIGLARGYQIWAMSENGDCEEVASERKGPLRAGHLLPFVTDGVDKFRDQRPLFAMVDGNPMSSDHKHCVVSFLSLKLGKVVHTLDFSDPVYDIESSTKMLLIVLGEKMIICDHETLAQRFSVVVPPSPDSMPPCFAVSDCLLAFADFNLDKLKQSCGGVMPDAEVSYGGQVMNAAKSITKTMASIGESFVSSFTAASQCKNAAGSGDSVSVDDSGIVSVINVNNLPPLSNKKGSLQHYIAHFIAHDTSQIGYLAFGNGGNLLLTGTQGSTTFHLFILHPHPTCVKLSSVQHIYTLHRGNSAAKVLHSAFSADNRWLSISTNHGTTHVYAITPYGGPVNARTHCGKFVNKESRFQRSAGITSVKQLSSVKSHQSAIKPTASRIQTSFREHPALVSLAVMSRTSPNPRLTYYEPPIQLFSLAKLKHRAFSPENLSAWASDNTPTLLGGGVASAHNGVSATGRQPFHGHRSTTNGAGCWLTDSSNRRMAVAFSVSFGNATSCADYAAYLCGGKNAPPPPLCLYIMNTEGVLTEHKVDIRREHSNGMTNTLNGSTESLSSSSPTGNTGAAATTTSAINHRISQQDTPVRTKIAAVMQWILRRNRGASSVEVIDPPLSPTNPLIQLCDKALEKDSALLACEKRTQRKDSNVSWLRQVEVVTYSGPHRRLWMGPQFSFGVYATSGHFSAHLFNPNNTSNNANEHSTFPSMQKCCPVLIEKNPVTPAGFSNCDSSMSRIVCGSWSSDIVDPRTVIGDPAYVSVKEKIEDAMREITEPPTHKEEPRKKNKKRLPTAKCSSSSTGTNDSSNDLLNLSGMEL